MNCKPAVPLWHVMTWLVKAECNINSELNDLFLYNLISYKDLQVYIRKFAKFLVCTLVTLVEHSVLYVYPSLFSFVLTMATLKPNQVNL